MFRTTSLQIDVLNPSFAVLQNCFLEASAGTGKTFAIEQLVARLLLEGNFKIEEILAVTFTRAAARDMRCRIRANLEKLSQGWMPPYRQALYERGEKIEIEERIQEALLYFDKAQVFTIHGFCQRILAEFAFEGCIAFEREDSRARSLMRNIVCDFLRTGLCSTEEAELLLRESRQQLDLLIERIIHAIEQPKQGSILIQKIAKQCRILWLEKSRAEEILTPDLLLERMEEALKAPFFLEKIQGKYRALIVDEFQDTDPISWRIFERIFLQNKKAIVYLVGDPKQSIYGFRNADIHTYLHARETFEKQAFLCTNYRSRPTLVHALNFLFSSSNWIDLPELPGALSYIPVSAGRKDERLHKESAIHFFLSKDSPGREKNWPTKRIEREKLFPFIASELKRLHEEKKVSFKEMAILVKDRFQAERLSIFLRNLSFPISVKQTMNLTETKGFIALEELLRAALYPEDRTALQKVIQRGSLRDRTSFLTLHHSLVGEGLPIFCQKLLKEGLIEEDSMQQTMEILLEIPCPPQQLLQKLQELKRMDLEEEPRLKVRQSTEEDQVAILTLFASKGLEFSVVFALGLASRQAVEEEAEIMRQLYVAMTRAKEKLYLPLLFHREGSTLSPIEIFWKKRFGKTLIEEEALHFFEEKNLDITSSWAEKREVDSWIKEELPESMPSLERSLPEFPKTFITSFSSLSNKIISLREEQEKDCSGIPSGPETGTLIHATLEKLFGQEGWYRFPKLPTFKRIIKETLQHTLLHSHLDAVEEMLIRGLQFPLWEGFCLQQLSPESVSCELEFLFPEGNSFIKGFIDLFFCHEQRWYILDWKMNRLPSSLQSCMKENHYFLQAAIYKEAMQRYVKLFDKNKTATFGGVIYLFLRGPSVYHIHNEEMAFSLAAR